MFHDFRTLVKDATGIANVDWGGSDFTVYPQIVMWIISEPAQHTFSGRDVARHCIVQVDIYAFDMATAIDLKTKLMQIDGYAGDTTSIKNVLQNMLRFETTDMGDAGEKLFRFSVDFTVHYIE